jgi:hypothetical protein
MNQPELPLHTSSLGAPDVTDDEIEHLCSFLRGRGWMRAAEICPALSIDDRKLRAIAQHSDGRILSGPGCPGYKLFTGRAEIEEADRCASRIESQARQMFARAVSIRRRFHRYARS